MTPTHTRKNGKLYRYYSPNAVIKKSCITCPVGNVPAGEIESVVFGQLKALFKTPEMIVRVWEQAREHDTNIREFHIREAFADIDRIWDELFPREQERIIKLLVERVIVGRKADMDVVQAFFRARYGKAYGFRFKDWSDYQALGQTLGTGNGAQTAFQLAKNYTSGAYGYSREISKPVSGTVKIYLNSVLQSSGFSTDHATGIVAFTVAPGAGVIVSADFDFDVPVRFDTDALLVRADGPGIFVWDAIPIVELRL